MGAGEKKNKKDDHHWPGGVGGFDCWCDTTTTSRRWIMMDDPRILGPSYGSVEQQQQRWRL